MMKTTIVWVSMSMDYLYLKGKELGLGREALENFMHFNEVALEVKVSDDGVVMEVIASRHQ